LWKLQKEAISIGKDACTEFQLKEELFDADIACIIPAGTEAGRVWQGRRH